MVTKLISHCEPIEFELQISPTDQLPAKLCSREFWGKPKAQKHRILSNLSSLKKLSHTFSLSRSLFPLSRFGTHTNAGSYHRTRGRLAAKQDSHLRIAQSQSQEQQEQQQCDAGTAYKVKRETGAAQFAVGRRRWR